MDEEVADDQHREPEERAGREAERGLDSDESQDHAIGAHRGERGEVDDGRRDDRDGDVLPELVGDDALEADDVCEQGRGEHDRPVQSVEQRRDAAPVVRLLSHLPIVSRSVAVCGRTPTKRAHRRMPGLRDAFAPQDRRHRIP